jgi:hypothetical protein
LLLQSFKSRNNLLKGVFGRDDRLEIVGCNKRSELGDEIAREGGLPAD